MSGQASSTPPSSTPFQHQPDLPPERITAQHGPAGGRIWWNDGPQIWCPGDWTYVHENLALELAIGSARFVRLVEWCREQGYSLPLGTDKIEQQARDGLGKFGFKFEEEDNE